MGVIPFFCRYVVFLFCLGIKTIFVLCKQKNMAILIVKSYIA